MEDSKSKEYLQGYKYYQSHKTKRPYSYLLVRINNPLNNYEISRWEGVYLNVWIKNNINPYITVDDLLGSFSIDDLPIFRQYFSIYNDQIDICTFLEFVVVFAFFPIANLIPLICSINGIQSNRVINKQQLSTICDSLAVKTDTLELINTCYDEMKKDDDDYIYLFDFVESIRKSDSVFYHFRNAKYTIIENVIGYDIYNTILQRKRFYLLNESKSHTDLAYPKENCIEYLDRKLCMHTPPLLYYDYISNNFKENSKLYLLNLRRRYGYAQRYKSSGNKSSHTFDNTISMNSVNISDEFKYSDRHMHNDLHLSPSKNHSSNNINSNKVYQPQLELYSSSV